MYNQLDDTWDSDHFPIVFKLETHRGIYSSDGLSVRYSGFTKVLTDAVHEASGRRPNQLSSGKRIRREKSGNPNSWWDKDCDNAVNDRKMALREFKRNKCLNKYIEYKRCRAVARKITIMRIKLA
ncbi:PREDICTED: uncharacterized protein LOC108766834 isoform X1 [Trachymyrmex cornetzi]|uniref:uncharacterized protein LOC108766834 isoform X1 n=1 Tax=Trachymyrmex cornetzi TaxID=471704 RepID=UPI00084F7D66|nr:PREDICTED: uncharacterized protein LOC108766834 isoform X1 [Trachymyrmex cornetzi]